MAVGIGVAAAAIPLRTDQPRLEITLAEDQSARVELGPGALHVDSAATELWLTPFGAAGTF